MLQTALQFDSSIWLEVKDGNLAGYAIYRRHYSAKNKQPKIRQFVGPGEKLVLITPQADALFVWRKFIDDSGQQGINCAVFRNESDRLSSSLIREAETLAWQRWPGERLYTYVNAKKIKSVNPGYCFKKAGWKRCGMTKNKLIVLEKLPKF